MKVGDQVVIKSGMLVGAKAQVVDIEPRNGLPVELRILSVLESAGERIVAGDDFYRRGWRYAEAELELLDAGG